jgi:ribosome-associated heat shock protein Hsp15
MTTRRLDQWLWFARLFKSRTLAERAIEEGAIRLNRTIVAKPSQAVRPGDVLSFCRGDDVMIIRVRAPGNRRGPAEEAQDLYEIVAA